MAHEHEKAAMAMPRPKPALDQTMDELGKIVSEAENLADELRSNLGQILKPTDETYPSEPDTPLGEMSPLRGQLEIECYRIRRLCRQLRDLIERVEI